MLPIVTPAPRRARYNRPGLSSGRSRTKSLSVSFFNHEKSYLVFNLLFIPTTTPRSSSIIARSRCCCCSSENRYIEQGSCFLSPLPTVIIAAHEDGDSGSTLFARFCKAKKKTFQLRTHYRQIGSASPECPCYQVRITSTHRERAIDMASVSVMISFVSDFLFSVFFLPSPEPGGLFLHEICKRTTYSDRQRKRDRAQAIRGTDRVKLKHKQSAVQKLQYGQIILPHFRNKLHSLFHK